VTTAAALIIGDEILSGKVADTNGPLLIALLADLGVRLQRLVYLGDEMDDIAAEVRACSDRFDAVITSGGIGPTHDDCTIAAVARAFGVGVDRDPDLEAMIRAWWADRLTDDALRMADVPAGARLLYGGDGLLPLVVIRNVYLLPGIPRLFEAKLPALRSELAGVRLCLSSLYLRSDESRVAALLRQVDGEFPAVKIGSYPRLEAEDFRIWVTVEAEDGDVLEGAVARLLALLPADEVVRVERAPAHPPDRRTKNED
jgi:molybdenum cofactor synthesis domain-containing protein